MSPSQKFFVVAVLLTLVGCSEEATTSSAPTPSTPLVELNHVNAPAPAADEFRGFFAPGGIAAEYRATFSEGQVRTLEEKRTADARTGDYKFQGARLLRYQGAALGSADNLELEFDLQGKVLVARAGEKTASAEQISAIRDRAQSLRSHAVAQYAVKGHDRN